MAIENDKNKASNPQPQNTTSGKNTKILNEEKAESEFAKKQRLMGMTKEEKKQKAIAGLEIKSQTTNPRSSSKESEERYRDLCFSNGIQKVIATLYSRGIILGIAAGFLFMKIPRKYFPKDPVPEDDSGIWATCLTEWLVETFGPEQAYKSLTTVCILGLPVVHIGEALTVAKNKYIIDQIDAKINSDSQKTQATNAG